MRIAITGHLGTLGAPLYRRLKDEGHKVTGIDLRHSLDRRADIAEYRQIDAAMPDVDLVYHLAAEFGRHNGEDFTEQLWRSNVIGTKNMLRVQKERGFRMVFASSSEVYGEQSAPVLSESMIATSPGMLTNDYATSKWVNEGQIENATKRWGNEVMTLRFFNAYGPGEHYHAYRSVVCLFCYRAMMGLPYTVYSGYHRVFQYVDDLIDTLAACARRFHAGAVINVGGREYRSVEDMHEIVSALAGVDPRRNTVTFEDRDAHNIVNKRPDITRAVELLGHSPDIELEDGIDRTLRWMRAVYA